MEPNKFSDFLFLQGKRLVFVTNNSTKSRKQYGKKFETLGLSVSEVSSSSYFYLLWRWNFVVSVTLSAWKHFQEEIFASSFAAAAYLKSIDFPKDKKVISRKKHWFSVDVMLHYICQWMIPFNHNLDQWSDTF